MKARRRLRLVEVAPMKVRMFDYMGHGVRIHIDGDESWWPIDDLRAALGIVDDLHLANLIIKHEAGLARLHTPSGVIEVLNERSVASVISNDPLVHMFDFSGPYQVIH